MKLDRDLLVQIMAGAAEAVGELVKIANARHLCEITAADDENLAFDYATQARKSQGNAKDLLYVLSRQCKIVGETTHRAEFMRAASVARQARARCGGTPLLDWQAAAELGEIIAIVKTDLATMAPAGSI